MKIFILQRKMTGESSYTFLGARKSFEGAKKLAVQMNASFLPEWDWRAVGFRWVARTFEPETSHTIWQIFETTLED